MKRKYREAMRAAARERDAFASDASDALQQYLEMEQRRRALPAPPLIPRPALESSSAPWRPVMTEQQRLEHEQYVREHNLPF